MTVDSTMDKATAGTLAPVGTARLFAAGSDAGYQEHLRAYGAADLRGIGPGLIRQLEASGLTGRGGAGFAAWRKTAATAGSSQRRPFTARPVVIANGAEGEPLSFKDRTLLAHAPHLVLDGVLAAASAVRAGTVYVYAPAASIPVLEEAMAQRSDARAVRLAEAPESFISGEASAVVNAIATGSPVPLDKRGRLSSTGLNGRPTLVLNVETLAHVALIARFGPGWFRSAGSERDPGTRLVSVTAGRREQVLEIPGDAPLLEVLRSAGVSPEDQAAVLVGGYHGRWVQPRNLRLSVDGPAAETVRPGAGVLFALDSGQCGLEATARISSYLARASARQCGPCTFGLPALATVLERLAYGERDPALVRELARLSSVVSGRGACHHPDGTIQLIGSALEVFAADVQAHLAGRCTRADGGRG